MLRKPKNWTIRQFITHLTELNDYLTEFPNPSDTVTATKFSNHKLTDIATNAILNLWTKAMTYHDFDLLIHTPMEFTSFYVKGMSNMQEMKSHTESKTSENGKVHLQSQNGKQESCSNTNTRQTEKWSVLHQTNSLNTGKCKTLLAQAKKMHGAWEASGVAKGSSGSSASSNHCEGKNVM